MPNRSGNNGMCGGRWMLWLAFLAAALASAGCGYHVAGHAANLPSTWKTVAIPAFKNDTTRYRIEQRFTEAVTREFITRTKYQVVQDAASADAVLNGEVLSIETTPLLFNADTGQVTTMLVIVRTRQADFAREIDHLRRTAHSY